MADVKEEVATYRRLRARATARDAVEELRRQAADLPEMSLDEINAEISAVRAERKEAGEHFAGAPAID